jgi:hypothetical protein
MTLATKAAIRPFAVQRSPPAGSTLPMREARAEAACTTSLLSVRFGPRNRLLRLERQSQENPRMPDEEWIKTLEDGRKVKFIYQELPEDGAFIAAQIALNEVVYSVVLSKAGNPLSREDVESHFEGELSKK